MNYHPRGMYMWDTWYLVKNSVVHLYHLQKKRPGSSRIAVEADSIGHAVSTDLVHWQEMPPVLELGRAGFLDDLQPYTGCAVEHEGRVYLFYTMRSSRDKGRMQRIGLALGGNPNEFERWPNNPVIEPDPRWYRGISKPMDGVVDCRDPIVVPRNREGWFYGFYVARSAPIARDELPETSVIATARSRDLVNWEHLPPAFAPRKYACIEVPDVFELNGRWYLTCLTGNWYGNRGIFHDPNATGGTIYAVSNKVSGPYQELANSDFIVGRETVGISCRSLLFKGKRYVLYTQRERIGETNCGKISYGSLTTPKILDTNPSGELIARYSDLVESLAGEVLFSKTDPPALPHPIPSAGTSWRLVNGRWESTDGSIRGSCRSGWHVLLFLQEAESFIMSANIIIEKGVSAGLVFGSSLENPGKSAVVFLDITKQHVAYSELPDFEYIEAKPVKLQAGVSYAVRLVVKEEQIEIYLDGILCLQLVRYVFRKGHVGLFVDRARARFELNESYKMSIPRTKKDDF